MAKLSDDERSGMNPFNGVRTDGKASPISERSACLD
jgi:hypothetical protein